MYTYPNTTQQVTRKSTTTTETFDGDGNLVSREIYEEIEYAPGTQTPGGIQVVPAVTPNTPWPGIQKPYITNAVNTSGVAERVITSAEDEPDW